MKAIDLFAGCGGFSVGFAKADFDICIAVEFDKQIAKSYMKNHTQTKMIIADIKDIDNAKTFSKYCADVIIGGPPCQGFSMAGARIRKNTFFDDPRNQLFRHYFNIVKIVIPKIFIMENVKGMTTLQGGAIMNDIENVFAGIGYKIQKYLVNAKVFGIPQDRERILIIGSKFKFDIEDEIEKTKKEIIQFIPEFFDFVNVNDAISNLPACTTDGEIENLIPKTPYQKFLSSKDNRTFNHISSNHRPNILSRIKKVEQGENFTKLNERINSVHSGSYGRLDPLKAAPTITTRFDTPSGGRFIHPSENRTITPREAARIQSFPDDFTFVGTKSSICKQIGNAVPPKMAYFLALMIRRLLNENRRIK